MVDGCEICGILQKKEQEAVFWENRSWLAIVSREQSQLARLMVILKRHDESQSRLTGAEVIERWRLFKRFERLVMNAFGAITVNDECLMNHAFKGVPVEEAHPHVHNHWKPRYDGPVEFAGRVFSDPDFGDRIDSRRTPDNVPVEMRQLISTRLKEVR